MSGRPDGIAGAWMLRVDSRPTSPRQRPSMPEPLGSEPFEALLLRLGSDRETAGERYLQLRQRLVAVFEYRHCPRPEELADETLDRVARRLQEMGSAVRRGGPRPLRLRRRLECGARVLPAPRGRSVARRVGGPSRRDAGGRARRVGRELPRGVPGAAVSRRQAPRPRLSPGRAQPSHPGPLGPRARPRTELERAPPEDPSHHFTAARLRPRLRGARRSRRSRRALVRDRGQR